MKKLIKSIPILGALATQVYWRLKFRQWRWNSPPRDAISFNYSEHWYNEVYHKGRLNIHERTFAEINADYERNGYRQRLETVMNRVQIPTSRVTWLEVGCHLGLTAYWLASRYPNLDLFMFDFSEESVWWCSRTFPFKERAKIWKGSADNISLPGMHTTATFDFASCIDVTEHLPEELYKKMITELLRVLKPSGHLILMQGTSPLPEHIHILPEDQLVKDFTDKGFILIKMLPARHYLLRKESPNR